LKTDSPFPYETISCRSWHFWTGWRCPKFSYFV